jgi:hypothetical protein
MNGGMQGAFEVRRFRGGRGAQGLPGRIDVRIGEKFGMIFRQSFQKGFSASTTEDVRTSHATDRMRSSWHPIETAKNRQPANTTAPNPVRRWLMPPVMSDSGTITPTYALWTENQRRVFIDTVQVYKALSAVFRDAGSYRGGMHWKSAAGDRTCSGVWTVRGTAKAWGPRSMETEQLLVEFRRRKAAIAERAAVLRRRMAEQARFCKAVNIGPFAESRWH